MRATILILAELACGGWAVGAEPPVLREPPPVVACTFCSGCACPAGGCPAKCPVQAPRAAAQAAPVVTYQLVRARDRRGREVVYYAAVSAATTTTYSAFSSYSTQTVTGGCVGGNCPLKK